MTTVPLLTAVCVIWIGIACASTPTTGQTPTTSAASEWAHIDGSTNRADP